MKEIIKKGNKKNAIKKFKCGRCKTIFKSDEYRIGMGTGKYISDCPCCGYVAYVKLF